MPKNMSILDTHWPDFLFDCSNCYNTEECIKEGICRHDIPSDDDYDFDDKVSYISDEVNDFFKQEVYGSLSENFNERYNDYDC